MSQTCPIDGCSTQISNEKLMCATHWSQVPTDLQRAVYRSWAETQRTQPPKVRLALIGNYREKRAAAIAAVNALGVLG